jgi:ribosomal protein S18 acetylase RimI-like enzyme
VIEIRAARPDDVAALAAIDAVTWTTATSPAGVPTEPRPFFRADEDPTDTVVAVLDGVVVGYAKLRNPLLVPSHAHVLEINGLAVDPGVAGQGIGRALVEAAVAEAERRGARKVSLRVLGTNSAARRLYARCGFVEEGVLRAEFLLDGRYVDDVFMARFLA